MNSHALATSELPADIAPLRISPAPTASPGRISIVCHSHPSLSKGGAEIAAYNLFTGLLQLGIDAIFITACAEADRARLALASPREHAVFHDPNLYDHLYHVASPTVVSDLMTILYQKRIDLVNFHHFYSFGIDAVRAAAAEPALRTVVTLHEFLAICHHHGQMITRPARLLCEAASLTACNTCYPENTRQQFALRRDNFLEAFRAVDHFVSPSHFLAGRFVAWGIPRERMSIIENGLARLPALQLPPRTDAARTWVFGFFGQINPFKGVDVILQAVRLIARDRELAARVRIRLHGNVIGQSESFTTDLNAMLENHDFLTYAGAYDNAMVGNLMAACHYVLVPSAWWENSPVVIQESFAARRPVICTGIGGMAEKVRDSLSGLHFAFNDHADLVRVIRDAATPELFVQLCENIPSVSDGTKMARTYYELFGALNLVDKDIAPFGELSSASTQVN